MMQGARELYPRAVFSEGLAIDYKWFDKWEVKPRYEFGFGLRCARGVVGWFRVAETRPAIPRLALRI